MAYKVNFTIDRVVNLDAALAAARTTAETPYSPKTGEYKIVGVGTFAMGDGADTRNLACIFLARKEDAPNDEWVATSLTLWGTKEVVAANGTIETVSSPFSVVTAEKLLLWADAQSKLAWGKRAPIVVDIKKVVRLFEGRTTPTIHNIRYIVGSAEALASAKAYK